MLEKKGIHVQSTGTCAMNSAHLENEGIIGAISSNNSSGMANARHSDISFPALGIICLLHAKILISFLNENEIEDFVGELAL